MDTNTQLEDTNYNIQWQCKVTIVGNNVLYISKQLEKSI